MEHFDLSIVPDKNFWKVISRGSADGPYKTLDEALDIAMEAARVLQAAGHTTAIRMPHRDGSLKVSLEPSLVEDTQDISIAPAIGPIGRLEAI